MKIESKLLNKICDWRDIAEKQKDYFIKFALEYFTFNALLRIAYFPDRIGVRDRDLINRLKEDEECKEYIVYDRKIKDWIQRFKDELDGRPLKNLSRNLDIRLQA